MNTAERVFHAAQKLSRELETIPGIPLPPAVVGADPTDYCADYFRAYLDRAAAGRRPCLIVGMNPSPHGQAQNGVPFGDTPTVRRILAQWLGSTRSKGACVMLPNGPQIYGGTDLSQPLLTVDGLNYGRGEESGRRLCGLLEPLCGSLDAVLERCLLVNYCSLVLLDAGCWPWLAGIGIKCDNAEAVRAIRDCDGRDGGARVWSGCRKKLRSAQTTLLALIQPLGVHLRATHVRGHNRAEQLQQRAFNRDADLAARRAARDVNRST